MGDEGRHAHAQAGAGLLDPDELLGDVGDDALRLHLDLRRPHRERDQRRRERRRVDRLSPATAHGLREIDVGVCKLGPVYRCAVRGRG